MHKIVLHHKKLNKQLSKYTLPQNVEWLVPYTSKSTLASMDTFYHRFYPEHNLQHSIIFGINPGRFGSGLTGVAFTDPIKLQEVLGEPNDFPKKAELSAQFIYTMIDAFGGASDFYKEFYITSLCPLGFVKDGINYNYYDDKKLQESVTPFIIRNIKDQIKLVNATTEVAFCLGEGKNYKFFESINSKYHFFKRIIPLPHPRWVMQYRRKKMQDFVQLYLKRLIEKEI